MALGSSENAMKLKAVREKLAVLVAPGGAVAPMARGPISQSRFHGDLHLGQVMAAKDDFVIVDFEGEPGRGLERRKQKGCVLRDVAGMVRSFSYAAHAALLKREPGAAGAEAAARALGDWERDAARHFIEGYLKAAQGLATVPSDPQVFHDLLELFLVEKAAYELRYEIAHRPDWIEIPLRGLLEMVKT